MSRAALLQRSGFLFAALKISKSMSIPSSQKNAILLVMFGTSVEEGLSGLLQIRERFIRRFPRSVVRLVFTSKIIRKIWQDRAADPHYRETHPAVP